MPLPVYTYFAGATRLKNTRDGNPCWEIHTGSGFYKTEPDAQVGLEMIDYSEPSSVRCLIDKRVILILNEKQKVIHITELKAGVDVGRPDRGW